MAHLCPFLLWRHPLSLRYSGRFLSSPRERFQARPFDEKTSMKYGYFDDAKREYVITNPRPRRNGSTTWGRCLSVVSSTTRGACSSVRAIPRSTASASTSRSSPASQCKGSTLYFRLREGSGYGFSRRSSSPRSTLMRNSSAMWGSATRAGSPSLRHPHRNHRVRSDRRAHLFVKMFAVTNETSAPLALDAIPVIEYTHLDALNAVHQCRLVSRRRWCPRRIATAATWCSRNMPS